MRVEIVSQVRSIMVDRRAHVAMTTAVCAFFLFSMAGLSIDYASAISTKSKLDAAADAAVVAAITKAKAVIAGGDTVASAITQGKTQGAQAFKANVGALGLMNTPPVPTVDITPSPDGRTLTANVSYRVDSDNRFSGKLFNALSTSVGGASSSWTVVTPYYQFIFVVDISGSMAIGGTPGDINGLYNDNNIMMAGDGHTRCSFACHDPSLYRTLGDPRSVAKKDKWNLKIDYANQAIINFINDLSNKKSEINGVFSIGIDTFASSFNVAQAPTTNFQDAQYAAAGIDIENMADPGSNWINIEQKQGYTRTSIGLQKALSQLNNIGDGTSPNKQSTYIIFLSDGVEDVEGPQNIKDPVNRIMYGRTTDLSYTSVCSAIKLAGATLISIVTPYPNITLAQDPDGQYQTLVQSLQPPAAQSMTTAMQNCATPTPDNRWFAEADDGPGINKAVQQALTNILAGMTRLTQ